MSDTEPKKYVHYNDWLTPGFISGTIKTKEMMGLGKINDSVM